MQVNDILGIKAQYLGSFGISLVVGAVLASAIFYSYLKGTDTFKLFSRCFTSLFLALIFFGVFLDALHSILDLHGAVYALFGLTEDGGELVVASLLLCYVYSERIALRENSL